MNTWDELAERYVAVWNEPDAEARRRRIAGLWIEDGLHCTPSMEARGHAALERRIIGAWEKWVKGAGHSFRYAGDADSHHGGMKFHWEMRSPDDTLVSLGFDFLLIGADGRIAADYQFIER